VLIATFADPKELGTVTTGVLPRNEAEPGRHMAPILEITPVADGSDNSRGYLRPHALDPGDPLSQGARPKGFIDPAVEYRNAAVDFPQEVKELCNRRASTVCQSVLGVLQDLGNCAAKLSDVPRKDQAPVTQKAPDLTGEGRTVVHETLSRPVERLDILLFCRTTGYEAHIGLLQRRADRLCVVRVVLLAKPEGLHVLRTNDPDSMSEPFKSFRPEVCAGRGLDPDDARLDLSDQLEQLRSQHSPAQDRSAHTVYPMKLKDILRQVDTKRLDGHDVPPSAGVLPYCGSSPSHQMESQVQESR
jgi:hypothetical protein